MWFGLPAREWSSAADCRTDRRSNNRPAVKRQARVRLRPGAGSGAGSPGPLGPPPVGPPQAAGARGVHRQIPMERRQALIGVHVAAACIGRYLWSPAEALGPRPGLQMRPFEPLDHRSGLSLVAQVPGDAHTARAAIARAHRRRTGISRCTLGSDEALGAPPSATQDNPPENRKVSRSKWVASMIGPCRPRRSSLNSHAGARAGF
jgi:hypothetical protein